MEVDLLIAKYQSVSVSVKKCELEYPQNGLAHDFSIDMEISRDCRDREAQLSSASWHVAIILLVGYPISELQDPYQLKHDGMKPVTKKMAYLETSGFLVDVKFSCFIPRRPV
jgi:hypothetical protein